MGHALLNSKVARLLLDGDGPHEQTITWTDGIQRKCRLDKHLDGEIIVDLKTADDPSAAGFARKCAAFGYFRQADWYLEGVEALTKVKHRFVYVVVGSKPPFEVFCFEPDPDDMERSAAQNDAAIEGLRRCLESGDWSTPGSDRITLLRLPNHTRYEDSYLLEA